MNTHVMRRGFITIPILIVFAVGALALGGTGFAAYKLGQTSNANKVEITAADVIQAEASKDQNKSVDTSDSQKNPEVNSNGVGEIETLRQEIATLQNKVSNQQKVATPKVAEVTIKQETAANASQNIVALPNGAVVEMGANGEIVRYIKQPDVSPVQTSAGSTTTPQSATTTEVAPKITISNVRVTTGISTARLEWSTSKPTKSKVFISSPSMLEKAFESDSGLSTKHYVDLVGFDIKSDVTYSYDIEAIDSVGTDYTKKSGTFALLPRPYAELLPAIKTRAVYNDTLTCSQLFNIPYEYLICVDYRAGL